MQKGICRRIRALGVALLLIFCSMQMALAGDGTNSGEQLPEHLIIPAYDYRGNEITSIKEKAYYRATGVHTAIIPYTVKSIGNQAFANCTSLYAIVIPETVASIADTAFDGMHSRFTIVTPTESYAATYALKKGINCVLLPQNKLAEADEMHVSTILFKLNFLNSDYFSRSINKGTYLKELSESDYIMLGMNNRNAAFNFIVDLFISGDNNSYMAERYAEQIGNILNDMKNFKPTQINLDIIKDPMDALSISYKGYIEFVEWLHDEFPPDDPFLRAIMNARIDLENYANGVGTFSEVTNFILYYLTDYTDAVDMLNLLQEMAEISGDKTFSTAVNILKVKYDESIAGIINKGIQEVLLPGLVDVAQKAWSEYIPVLGYYSLASKALDIALNVSGSKEYRDKQLAYLALHEICVNAESICRVLFESEDCSVEEIRKLQTMCEFYRVALCRLYNVQLELITEKNDKENLKKTLEFYETADNLIYSLFRHGEKTNENKILYINSLLSYWQAHDASYIFDRSEYGYTIVNNMVSEKIDGILLGEMGSWYIVYGGARDAEEMIEQIAEERNIEKLKDLWNTTFGNSEIRLSKSELYKQEQQMWEGKELIYVSEIWTEFYLFTGVINDHNQSRSFELLILLEGDSEGGHYDDFIIIID